MLKLGTQDISALYLGETKIKRAYLGETPVFEGSKPSRLPEGYTEVEYINTAAGNAGLSFGLGTIQMNQDRIVVDITFHESKAFDLFGSTVKTGNNNNRIYCFAYRSSNAEQIVGRFGYSTYATNYKASTPNEKRLVIDMDFKGNQLLINDVKITSWANANVTSGTAKAPDTSYSCNVDLHEVLFYKNGVLRYDFVPCIRDSDGALGAYRLVSSPSFINLSTYTNLVAGPPV